MARKAAKNNESKEDYLISFDKLKTQIKEFQNLPITSTVFQFLEHISPYDYTTTHKKEIIKNEYPNLWNFSERFNKNLSEFRAHLREKYFTIKPIESKNISVELAKAVDQISNTITEEKVKVRIQKSFTDENRYNTVEHFGIKMRELKPYVWKEFKPEMVNESYLFEDYFGFLYGLLLLIDEPIEEFSTGYKGASKIEAREIDFTVKPKSKLQDYIKDRWKDFEKICLYYSEKRTFRSGVDAVVINYITSKGEFHWEGIGDSSIPPLGQFINALKSDGFFSFRNRERIRICESFLKFFHLPVDDEHEKGKYLKKQMDDDNSLYIGFFTTKIPS